MKKIFNCTDHYLNNFTNSIDESFAFFKMAAGLSPYRVLVFFDWKFFQGQALGTR